jgi:serine/threonine protein kinase
VHESGYIHRDLKPDNILLGRKSSHMDLYLIDFGLSRKYLDNNCIHCPYSENVNFKGNIVFSSKNCLLGVSPGRRDDFESICYLLIFMQQGALP